jgi:hypothetical protein
LTSQAKIISRADEWPLAPKLSAAVIDLLPSVLAAPARLFFNPRTMPDFSSLDPPQAAPFAAADASATAPERTSRRPAPAAAMP